MQKSKLQCHVGWLYICHWNKTIDTQEQFAIAPCSQSSVFITNSSPLTHHSDSIIEEALSEHYDVELLVHRHVLKHVQHSHGVHGRDDGGEQQVLLEVDVLHAKGRNLAYGEQRDADANAVPQSPHHGEPQHLHENSNKTVKVEQEADQS